MWFLSLPVAVFLIWFAWAVIKPPDSGGGTAALWAWTVGVVVVEAVNFRMLYLGRGRRAEAIQRALDDEDAT